MMQVSDGGIFNLPLRLSGSVVIDGDDKQRIVASVTRGKATSRYIIDSQIHYFLQQFALPRSLSEVADQLADEGYSRDNVLQFGKNLVKTPLLEFCAEESQIPEIELICQYWGWQWMASFKHRKFDGVYQVVDSSGCDRVIKAIRSPQSYSETMRISKQLENERAVMLRLQGIPEVVRVIDWQVSPFMTLSMEYIHGRNLTECVLADASIQDRLNWCRQISRIVRDIHSAGVVHGDLHTSNFMCEQTGLIRAIDFDSSFVAGSPYIPRIGGAAHFMPPERCTDHWHESSEATPDFASDIYQLGVILYFVLTGKPPFRGETYSELMKMVKAGHFRKLESIVGENVPMPITQSIHDCLAIHPALRPASLDNLVGLFEEFK
ncbi:serine/threonine protein kinase [Parachitinimonas caeni]|uniref:Protein kinase n=1 Tax=Parachitinimonas caeni TaxID=3031301 RepID=A0ABT7DZ04_9NEIS|nr:protein kinase [Parachitinimonas caeni]MDK2123897.1 protein kinase [Parachitinimonas caeni]